VDGGVEFVNVRTGGKSRENPTVRMHQQVVRQARLMAKPQESTLPALYEFPPARFAPGEVDEATGQPLTTPQIPATGPWMDFTDYYGRTYWYNLVTGRVQESLGDYRREACAVAIQRHWRGTLVRREVLRQADAVAVIETFWRNRMFRRCMALVHERRERAAVRIQRAWYVKKHRREFCEEMVVAIGLLGMKRPARSMARLLVPGLLGNPRPFTYIRRKVILIQRAVRAWVQIRNYELPSNPGLISDAVVGAREMAGRLWGGY